MPEVVLEWGIAVILILQGLGDWLITPMNFFTFMGNVEFYLLIMPVLYWCYDSRLGLRMAVVLTLSIAINLIFKIVVHDPRPYWVDPRVRLLTNPETTFGIPSGHGQNAVVLWGLLAAHFRKGWVWTAVTVIIFFIGFSRMYLGVHFPTDVLAGWAIGIVLLALFLGLERSVVTWMKQWGEWVQVTLVFAISLAVIGIGVWISSSVAADWQLPSEWIQNAAAIAPDKSIAPLSIKDLVLSAAVFSGIISGAILFDSRGGFDTRGPWLKRLGRYLVGIVGILLLWQGLDVLFGLLSPEESLLGYTLRYVRYGLIGVWISALGPIVFIRLGLAEYKTKLQQS